MRIASLLSFVAGIVNIAGFLAIQRLTTNVTGHFAYLIDEVFKLDAWNGLVYFLYIFFFFLGSFISGLMVEFISKKNNKLSYVVPIFLESVLLFSISIFGPTIIAKSPDLLACVLLFAMGLQNSLVTIISSATVRTTHLTGLFTDLGIELSQLFFYRQTAQQAKLLSSIKLRLTIIGFFFLGGIAGAAFYSKYQLHVLAVAGTVLTGAMAYDYVKLRLIVLNRKRAGH